MRNKFPGKCYICGKEVKPGEGHFERMKLKNGKSGYWRVQHASHAIRNHKMGLTGKFKKH